jgi:tripartite-type tricarboxylate transporter receptor subunit TctC
MNLEIRSKRFTMHSLLLRALLLTSTFFVAADTLAETAGYPSRPIKMVVPYQAGGPADYAARAVGQELEKELGQPVVAENRGGAGGAVGIMGLVRAPADGYTLA